MDQERTALLISPLIRHTMKRLLLPLLLLVGPLLGACECDDIFPDSVKGEGAAVSEDRSTAAFSGVRLAIDADVYLSQGSVQSIRVEAQRNVLDVLQTEVRDNQLCLGFGRTTVRRHDPIRVYLTMPTLTSVEVAGSGRVVGQGPLNTQDLRLDVAGSGSVALPQLTVRDLRTTLSGSGDMQLGGTARRQQLTISGSGKLDGFALALNTAEVNINGSGGAELSVAETLQATISGSGVVYYRGRPAVTSRISGSGRVVSAN